MDSPKDDFSTKDYRNFLFSTTNLIIRNPVKYIKAKLPMFLASAGISRKWRWVEGILDLGAQRKVFDSYNISYELERYLTPINQEIRAKFVTLINCMYRISNNLPLLFRLFWNSFFPLLMLFVLWLISIFKRMWVYFSVASLYLAEFAIVFLFASAANVMYYLPFYIGGYMLAIYYVIDKVLPIMKESRITREKIL